MGRTIKIRNNTRAIYVFKLRDGTAKDVVRLGSTNAVDWKNGDGAFIEPQSEVTVDLKLWRAMREETFTPGPAEQDPNFPNRKPGVVQPTPQAKVIAALIKSNDIGVGNPTGGSASQAA